MRNSLLRFWFVAIVLLLGVGKSFAQPSFFFQPATQVGNVGDVVCVDITVDDFTDLLTVDYQIAFDSTVMTFNGPQNIALPGLNASDITLLAPGAGRIDFSWEAPSAGSGIGIDFPDNQRIVSLCFTLIGSYGESSDVAIANAPRPFVTRQFSGGRNIGLFTEKAQVAIGVFPLHLNIGSAGAAEGGSVCVDVTADNFANILSFQFSVGWDETVLSYTGVTGLNSNLPGLQPSSFVSSSPGKLSVLYPDRIGTTVASLPDGEVLFQLCFDIVGLCDESSSITITEDPVQIDVYNDQSSNPIALTWDDGQIDVFACGGGLRLVGDVRTSSPGASVCIPFTVQGFQNISAMNFDIDWNQSILQFTGVNIPSSGVPPGFGAGNFDLTNAASGSITLDWSLFPWSMSNGSELFELCFTVVGAFGMNGTIIPDGLNGSVIQGGSDIGLNPRQGEVVILPSNPLEISIGSATGDLGAEVCVDITVEDFNDLQTVRYSMIWEPTIMTFNRIENFALPNQQPTTFDSSIPGALGLNWWDFSGSTLSDGDVLYTVCFDVVGRPASCTPLEVSEFPTPIFVEAAATQGYTIGLESNPGDLCVTDNRSFTLAVGDGNVSPPSVGCVPVTVTDYTDIEDWSVSVAWNPAQFAFDNLTPLAITGATLDLSEVASGRLGISNNHGAPTTLADGTVVFDLCFTAVGTAVVCSPILEETRPLNNQATQAGESKVVVFTDGEVCSEEGISLTALVTDVNCSNETTGAIDLTATGASGFYTYAWTGNGVAANAEDQTVLGPGVYQVTVTDNSNPSIAATASYTVNAASQVPVVDAGRDTILACDAAPVFELDGTATDISGGKTFVWRILQSGTTFVTGENTLQPTVFGVGGFELQVTNPDGCVGRDTVEVQRIEAPTITVVRQSDIPCGGGEVDLEVRVEPAGNYRFSWETTDGNIIGATDQLTIRVDIAGSYVITVTDDDTSCEKQASIGVSELSGTAVADAGPARSITCDSATVRVGGTNTSLGADYEYRWSTVNGAMQGPTTSPTVTATQPGRYYLSVLDIPSGCEAVDSVDVNSAGNLPVANAGAAAFITCERDTAQLSATGDSGGDFEISWSTSDGLLRIGTTSGFAPIVESAGTYVLTIRDTVTGCESNSQVIVRDSTETPSTQLPQTFALGCDGVGRLIDPVYNTDSAAYAFAWVNTSTLDTLSRTASFYPQSSGNYEMLVTNRVTGCDTTALVNVTIASPPSVQLAASDSEFICGRDSIELSLAGSDFGSGTSTVEWIGLTPSPDILNSALFYATVPGNYQAVLVGNPGDCRDTLDVPLVLSDTRTILSVDAGDDLTIDCTTTTVDANATRPQGQNEVLSWSSIDGYPIVDPASITGGFSESGQYVLTFRDTVSNCTGRDTIEVIRQGEEDVDVNLGDDFTLDCTGTAVTITANYTTPTDDVSISWEVIAGSGPQPSPGQTASISTPGTYVVEVLYNPTGCTSKDTVVVGQADQDFSLSSPNDLTIECGEEEGDLIVDFVPGAGSYNFLWTVISGELRGANDTERTTATTGLYQLLVVDMTSGCRDSVQVELRANTTADPAEISFTADPCTNEISFVANPVVGASGVWEVSQGGVLTQLNDLSAVITGAAGESYTVVYTLSTTDCPNYSFATEEVTITDVSVSATNDAVFIPLTSNDTTIDVSVNDAATLGSTYRLVDSTPTSSITAEGEFSFGVVNRTEQITLTYEVCDVDCPNVCTTATILLQFEQEEEPVDEFEGADFPNAITPNDDGLNDAFVVEPMVRTPEDFPNARLTVFNRWGDILFTQQPYTNDWKGVTNDGKELPQGTYYYVLELELNSNNIHKGHLTILR